MLSFNAGKFNQCKFNDALCSIDNTWLLYLDPDSPTLIATGAGIEVPPNLMFPGQRYKIERRGPDGKKTITIFRTPPSIVYDSLGG